MSYIVLARKWRPKCFSELVGQVHVMQALANALDQQRLHHAYLFTGTRGVGKTTIARIFSKALNCEQGISSTPCGVCDVCRSIDEGRFIDLIEVDAASRTKVDDTREILDNVQFAPTQGRYKVYLIDEVHMLSKSSFNALLKTLEEPPEHVKFLLATTDPHKLPVTVLSRCLQFNLMRLTQLQLQNHLEFIMTQEGLPFEKSALGLIAKGADGSARDALSLLDQAIAYGAGEVRFEPVQTMLGWVDQQYSLSILNALAGDDSNQLKAVVQQLAVMGVNYQALLAQLIEVLHALSYCQVFGDSTALSTMPEEQIQELASKLLPERVQLLYQIALLAKQDMLLSPDIRIGFEMALIRMLAFQPAQQGVILPDSEQGGEKFKPQIHSAQPTQNGLEGLASARSLMSQKAEQKTEQNREQEGGGNFSEFQHKAVPLNEVAGGVQESVEPYLPQEKLDVENPPTRATNINENATPSASSSDHLEKIKARLQQSRGKLESGKSTTLRKPGNASVTPVATPSASPLTEPSIVAKNTTYVDSVKMETFNVEPVSNVESVHIEQREAEPFNTEQANTAVMTEQGEENLTFSSPAPLEDANEYLEKWLEIIAQLPLKGMAAEVARNSVLIELSDSKMAVSIDPEQNYSRQPTALEQFSEAVKQCFGDSFELEFVSSHAHFTPVKYAKQQAEYRQTLAVEAIQQDAIVQAFTQTLGMEIVTESIQPV